MLLTGFTATDMYPSFLCEHLACPFANFDRTIIFQLFKLFLDKSLEAPKLQVVLESKFALDEV